MRCGRLLLAALVLLIGACARQPLREVDNFERYRLALAAIEDWRLAGKMNLRVPGESDTVRLIWRHSRADYSIRLSGALGMGASWIRGDERQVRLEQSGEEPIVADSPEDLAYSLLGRDIPFGELRYWILGLPAPRPQPRALVLGDDGVLSQLEQSGWTLEFTDYRAVDNWNLPGKIIARQGDLRLTLVVSEWTLGRTDL